MCAHVCMCVHVCMHVHVHVFLPVHACVYVCMCVHVHVCSCMRTCVYACACVYYFSCDFSLANRMRAVATHSPESLSPELPTAVTWWSWIPRAGHRASSSPATPSSPIFSASSLPPLSGPRGGCCSSRLRPRPSGQGSSSSPARPEAEAAGTCGKARGCRGRGTGAPRTCPAACTRLMATLSQGRQSCFLTCVLLVLGRNKETKASLLSCHRADTACRSGFCF